MFLKSKKLRIVLISLIVLLGVSYCLYMFILYDDKITESKGVIEKSVEDWETAYISFLNDLYTGREHPQNLYKVEELDDFDEEEWEDIEYVFLLKDLNNDDIPELIIENNMMNVTVYTYNEELTKIGNIDFRTATTKLLYSTNSSYPCIFSFWVGGGYEHHGYITIESNKLIEKELWNEDYSGISKELGKERERIEEYSDDKQLIAESRTAYKANNDLPFQEVHPDNFSQGLSIMALNSKS